MNQRKDIFSRRVPIFILAGIREFCTVKTKNGQDLKVITSDYGAYYLTKSKFLSTFPAIRRQLHEVIENTLKEYESIVYAIMLLNRITEREELISVDLKEVIKSFLPNLPKYLNLPSYKNQDLVFKKKR